MNTTFPGRTRRKQMAAKGRQLGNTHRDVANNAASIHDANRQDTRSRLVPARGGDGRLNLANVSNIALNIRQEVPIKKGRRGVLSISMAVVSGPDSPDLTLSASRPMLVKE